MDYSTYLILFGYSLLVIIITFWLRNKQPDNYWVGCILCFFAPAWGQFYINKKSSLYVWFIFMVMERAANRIINDSYNYLESLIPWFVFAFLSSLIMFFRLRYNLLNKNKLNENEDCGKQVLIDNIAETNSHKINGWQRLWILLSVIYISLTIIVIICYDKYPKERTEFELRSHYYSERMGLDNNGNVVRIPPDKRDVKVIVAEEREFVAKQRYAFVRNVAIILILPCFAAYFLGLSFNWVYKGFVKKRE